MKRKKTSHFAKKRQKIAVPYADLVFREYESDIPREKILIALDNDPDLKPGNPNFSSQKKK